MSLLLSPVTIARLSLKNRLVMAPMCMYEVINKDGIATPFHFAHYGARAIAGVGLIMLEATAVEPVGKINEQDLGLWNDTQAVEMEKLVKSIQYLGSKVGIQLGHAGRKADWSDECIAPSAIAFNKESVTPRQMSVEDIKRVQNAFIEAAKRAITAGVDMIELHGAHGYLINQFLSPLSNTRKDEYGGSLENRYRFVQEIIRPIREIFDGSLWIRLSLSDFDESGRQHTMKDWQQIGQWLEADGIDLIDVSTVGILEVRPNIPIFPGYQVKFATDMKKALNIPVAAVG
ncbi:MAG: NADH:flavin oxidoreductase/NADH oxidase, partial [Streptococcaceae bacterium]|nr:NADH:flavin oxidoreductase/NADH oxidase [Streptococcaceae bacterium]